MARASTTERGRIAQHGRKGVLTALGLVVMGLLLADGQGALRPLEDLAYDRCLSWQSGWSQVPVGVLQVDVSERPEIWSNPVELASLVEQLNRLGARRIGLAWSNSCASPPGDSLLGTLPDSLVFGYQVSRTNNDPRQWQLTGGGTPSTRPERWGCMDVAASKGGVCRSIRHSYVIEGKAYPSYEQVLTAGLRPRRSDTTRFWESKSTDRIRFRGGRGSLPHVAADLVLDNRLVPELVEGRVVLIGGSPETRFQEIHTPTADSAPGMGWLEVQAQAVNTLLNGSVIRRTGPLWRTVLVLLVAIIGLFVYTRCTSRTGFAVTAAAVGLLVGGALLGLARLNLWIPFVELGLTLGGTFSVVFARKIEYSRSALNHLLFDLSTRIWQRSWSTSFFSEEDPWPQVISFIRQILDLDRLIVLELPPLSHHLTEVKAYNCSPTDIREMRRDVRRWPYTKAVTGDDPLRIDVMKRPFLSVADRATARGSNPSPDAAEDQYLVPLRFAGELFGFLALGIKPEKVQDREGFERRLVDIAQQTAELLYRRRYVVQQQKTRDNPLVLLSRLPEETAFAELTRATRLLERRLSRYEQILQESGVSLAIYDLFGQLMTANNRMRDILRRQDTEIDDMTTVDLLTTLTGREPEDTRELLGKVIVQRESRSFPIELEQQRGSYMLCVRPLELSLPRSDDDDESAPLEIQGVLCELIDRSAVVELYRLKDRLTETLGHSLRNDLAAVELATSLILDKRTTYDHKRECETIIHEKVSQAAGLLREARGLLLCGDDEELTECVPVDPQQLLDQAIENLGEAIDAQRLSVDVIRPELTSHAFAVPSALRGILESMLDVLIQDARSDTTLEIKIVERAAEVILQFANEGFGVSTDKLKESLESEEASDGPTSLQGASEMLNQWGGRLDVAGTVGKGTRWNLALRRFS